MRLRPGTRPQSSECAIARTLSTRSSSLWWNWPVDAVTAQLRTIADGTVADLRTASASVDR